MRFKYYLRGVGFGILLTTIVLAVATGKKETMSDLDVMQRASELGMVMAETEQDLVSEQVPSTEQDLVSEQVPSTEQEVSTEPTPSTEQAQPETEQTSEVETEQTTQIESETEMTSEVEIVDGKVKIVIKKGYVCRDIADALKAAGVIDDRLKFRDYMKRHGYDKKIHVGTYYVDQDATFEEIVKILFEK